MIGVVKRREFLEAGATLLGSLAVHGRAEAWFAPDWSRQSVAPPVRPAARFGLLTDVHYADKPVAGTRAYRDSLDKMRVAAAALRDARMADRVGLSFSACLGDLVDSAAAEVSDRSIETEIGYLVTIEAEWAKAGGPRHYVLGNHCVDTLTKTEFFDHTSARPAPYGFDLPFVGATGGVRIVVLDACYTTSGEPYGRKNFVWTDTAIPPIQLRWLETELATARDPVIVLVHQRLDGAGDLHVRNAADVRRVLEASRRVLAVFQGHSHQNELAMVGGIPYLVVRALVEEPGPANNAFAIVEVMPDHRIAVRGAYRQTTVPQLGTPGAVKR